MADLKRFTNAQREGFQAIKTKNAITNAIKAQKAVDAAKAVAQAEAAINSPAQKQKRAKAQANVNARVKTYSTFNDMSTMERMRQGLGMEAMTAEQVQREVRNAQSRLSKDLRAARKDLASLTDANDPTNMRRTAIRSYIHRLEGFQDNMKQKRKDVEGKTVLNTRMSRLAAMRDYLLGYAGADNRKKALSGKIPRYLNDAAALFEKNIRNLYGFDYTDEPEELATDYVLADLYDEYEDALIAGNSDEAREIIQKIYGRLQDLYNYV